MINKINEYVYQLALFVGKGTIRADELSFEVRRRLDVGDFEPMLIPESPGMPDDFPRLQINTARGYRLTMSKLRVDLFLDLPLGLDKEDISDFFTKQQELLSILDERGVRYSRVGLIKTSFVQSSSAATYLLKKLTKLPAEDVSDAGISVTKKIICADIKSNSLYNFSNGVISTGVTGLVVMRDINTNPSSNADLTMDGAISFLSAANSLSGAASIVEFIGGDDV